MDDQDQAQSEWIRSVRYINGMIVEPIPPYMIEAAARLEQQSYNVASEDINHMDALQKAYHRQKRNAIRSKTLHLSIGAEKITNENVEEYLQLIDQCVRYLKWTEEPPFQKSEKEWFLDFIESVANHVRPEDQSEDEVAVTLWRKIINHVLDGGFPCYFDELWKCLEQMISRFPPEVTTTEFWEGLLDEEKIQIGFFEQVISFLLAATPDVEACEIWMKIHSLMFPYVIKCLDSVVMQSLITIPPKNPQHRLAVLLFSTVFNFLKIRPKELSFQSRQHIAKVFMRFVRSSSITNNEHLIALQVLSECYTVNELKMSNGGEITLAEDDVLIFIQALEKTLKVSRTGSFDGVGIAAYDFMEPLRRLIIFKENMLKFLQYDKDEEKDIISLVHKGIVSKDFRLQRPSLEVLRRFCDDESAVERIAANQKLLLDLDVGRYSPKRVVARLSTDILYQVRIRRPVVVTRNRMMRSCCVKWTESEVRRKMLECGYDIPQEVDTTDCNGRWLLELIMMRMENPPAYYKTIKDQFEIPADLSSQKFNVCMGKLEQLFLSQDLSSEPAPDESMNYYN